MRAARERGRAWTRPKWGRERWRSHFLDAKWVLETVYIVWSLASQAGEAQPSPVAEPRKSARLPELPAEHRLEGARPGIITMYCGKCLKLPLKIASKIFKDL